MLSFRAIARNLSYQDDEISPVEMTESATGHFARGSLYPNLIADFHITGKDQDPRLRCRLQHGIHLSHNLLIGEMVHADRIKAALSGTG